MRRSDLRYLGEYVDPPPPPFVSSLLLLFANGSRLCFVDDLERMVRKGATPGVEITSHEHLQARLKATYQY